MMKQVIQSMAGFARYLELHRFVKQSLSKNTRIQSSI